jgi:hypothetical protein
MYRQEYISYMIIIIIIEWLLIGMHDVCVKL